MKTVIGFTKVRFLMFAMSIIVIAGGFVWTYLNNGYNLGIDFKGGLSQQIQIAPVAFSIKALSASGDAGTQNFASVITFDVSETNETLTYTYAGGQKTTVKLADYETIDLLIAFLKNQKAPFTIEKMAETTVSPLQLIGFKAQLPEDQKLYFNYRLPEGSAPLSKIDEVRGLLDEIYSKATLQTVGKPDAQEYIIRVDADVVKAGDDDSVLDQLSKNIVTHFESKYGEGTVIKKAQESLGPGLAQYLATGSIFALVIAIGLILLWVTIRFQFHFAIAAIVALVHDGLFIIALVGALKVEINTATIAAILTIIGYSINDTIVVYDRIRENMTLLKGTQFGTLIDTSITQSLSRTTITALTTIIAIIPLYFLGAGPVKDFAFCMIFGIIAGTYSSIFIASPIVMIWHKTINRKMLDKDIEMFGRRPGGEEQERTDSSGDNSSNDSASGAGITRVQRVVSKKKKRKK
ncbi:MAG: protein translocase subunit SecF [Spirochaetales bacterium]|nr:protein translocase subunit SecF [Spirochaetales bacterium]